jgi:3'(2'), 5'-bisphosphate nucleotidase
MRQLMYPFQRTTPEARFLLEATRQAALLVRHIQDVLVNPSLTKEDRSPVTVADFAAQALVGKLLAQAFPDDALVAEENSEVLRRDEAALVAVSKFVSEISGKATPDLVCNWIDHNRVDTGRRFWTLDPIDGTKGFLRGDQYAVALALVVDGQVQMGALGCPKLADGYRPDMAGSGSLVAAVHAQGSWVTELEQPRTFESLHVSNCSNPLEAHILRSFEAGHTNTSQIDLFAQALGVQAEPVLMDSQVKYAVLAAGKGDLMLRLLSASQPNYKEKIWDQAAGSLVLEEAGGRISDLRGAAFDFSTGRSLLHNRGVLASNGLLHPASLRTLEQIGA